MARHALAGYDPVEIAGLVGDLFTEIQGDDFVGDDFVGAEGDDLASLLAIAGAAKRATRGRPAPSNALANALAARRAQAGTMLQTRGPTKSREYVIGLESTAAILAGAAARVSTQPQVPFRVDRVVVPSDIAGSFVISDIKVGKNSQLAAEGNISCRTFQENAVGVSLKGDTAQVSQFVTLAVQNISGGALTFRASIIGPAVE